METTATTTTKKATISYLLNEEGRKRSLLDGGDGKEMQVVETDITPVLMELADVSPGGEAVLNLTGEIVIGLEIGSYHDDYPNFKYTYAPGQYRHLDRKQYFAAPQTAEALIAWEKSRRDHIAARSAELQPALEKLQASYKLESERRAEEKASEKAREEGHRKKEREQREAEKSTWIAAHGSDHLRRAAALGYDCQRKYVTERAITEFPDFSADFDNRANWESRSCPSEAALTLAESLIESGHMAEVVWLTYPIHLVGLDKEEDYRDWEPREAVIVKNYLFKYVLVKDC